MATNLMLVYVWWSDTIVCNIPLHTNTTHTITSNDFEICKENYTLETTWPRASFNREYYAYTVFQSHSQTSAFYKSTFWNTSYNYAQDMNNTEHILKQKPLLFIPISLEMTIEIIKASCCELGKRHFSTSLSDGQRRTESWLAATRASTMRFVLLRGNSAALTIVTSELMACSCNTPPASHNCSINCVHM